MKYIKLFEEIKIDFDDIDEEEYDGDDIQIGDYVKIRDKKSLTTKYYGKENQFGDIEGEYEWWNVSDKSKLQVVDIKYKKDGTKLIRFHGQWPYDVASYWKKVNMNESINFDDIDYEDDHIPNDFIGHEDFYQFLLDNNVYDEFMKKFNISLVNDFISANSLKEYLNNVNKEDILFYSFVWEIDSKWAELDIKWRNLN